MTPYYSDALVTIYHGDCRDLAIHALLAGSPRPRLVILPEQDAELAELLAR